MKDETKNKIIRMNFFELGNYLKKLDTQLTPEQQGRIWRFWAKHKLQEKPIDEATRKIADTFGGKIIS